MVLEEEIIEFIYLIMIYTKVIIINNIKKNILIELIKLLNL